MGPHQVDGLTEICHGSPFDEDHYVFDGNDAYLALQSAERPLCLYGHTHLPAIFRMVDRDLATLEGDAPDPDREVTVPLQRGAQYLINVGAVGQPRDGDPRAGYGVLDDEAREVRLYRVRYAVEKAQQKIIAAGLPPSLANRLALGR
jgi:diadenosine tetraphosphatase ApaH/serine/threonine PP2A family protein phosphatase